MSAQPTRPARRPDESMSLIRELMEGALEPGYAAAAARRRAAGQPAATSTRSPVVVLIVLAIGVAMGVGAANLRAAAALSTGTGAALISQIEGQQAHADVQTAKVAVIEKEIQSLQNAALGPGQSTLLATLRALQILTGTVAVGGGGIVLTLDDAADAGAVADQRGSGGFDDKRVRAADLQIIVNALWAAGAEAISINGQRLTSDSAIRFAGQAILVGFRPLPRPYVITAIGDSATLQTTFASSAAGSYLKALQQNYGIRGSLTAAQDGLVCPAAPIPELRYAGAAPSTVPSIGTSRPPTPTSSVPATTRPSPTTTTTTTRATETRR